MLSMTGYGRGRANREGRDLLLELKAVNHRFLDISFRMPKPLSFLEEPLRARLGEDVRRGHVELSLTYRNERDEATTVTVDVQRVLQCDTAIRPLSEALHRSPPAVAELITLCDAMSVTQTDEDTEAVTMLALEAYAEAFSQLSAMRRREGTALANDLAANLAQAEEKVERIAVHAPTVPQMYRERLEARMAEWNLQAADPQRMAQEIALMADKCAVDEEISRLRSHFKQFRQCLMETGETGRRMDFLLQEMNRETNTIGSKASDTDIARSVVDIKCLLEKLREQVQNVV